MYAEMKKRAESIWITVCACGVAIILLALLLPPVPGCHRNRPRRIKAQVELSQICAALQAYLHEYGTIPDFGGQAGPEFIRVLSGNNPNGMMFMEFAPHEEALGFLDPWRNPYRVSVTTDQVMTIRVASFGKNGIDDGGQEDDLVETRSIQHQGAW